METLYERLHIKNSDGIIIPVIFKDCLFDQLGVDGAVDLTCKVHCYLFDKKLIIQNTSKPEADKVVCKGEECRFMNEEYLLMHPPFCPLINMKVNDCDALSSETSNRGVNVGIAVLVESSEGCILLTRRASHMRTFPGVWVPPGGHLEKNETILEAGLRELKEETGLEFAVDEGKHSKILGLWESVYPSFLMSGMPMRHHLVIYVHYVSSRSSKNISTDVKLNPKEVDACIWLPQMVVRSLIFGLDLLDDQNLPYTSISESGEVVMRILNASCLEAKMPPEGSERLSTGTRYALELWLKEKNKSTPSTTGPSHSKGSHL